MLGVPGLAQELVEAGLNRVTFSLHSAVPEVQDGLNGMARSFQQLKLGISEFRKEAERAQKSVELTSVTLLTPETIRDLNDTIEEAAAWGASLHIVQPFIASRETLHVARHYYVPLEDVFDAIGRAQTVAGRLGTRIKPYNLPYCMLPSHHRIELQEYGLATHKRQEGVAGESGQFDQTQFFRIERCQKCPTPCPGIRIEYRDRREMAAEIAEDVMNHRGAKLVIPGVELLSAEGHVHLAELLAAEGRRYVPMLGGSTWEDPEILVQALRAAGVDEVVHLLRTEWRGEGICEPESGNEERILALAEGFHAAGMKNTLFLSPLDLMEWRYPAEAVAEAFDEAVLAVPRFWRGAPSEEACARLVEAKHKEILAGASSLSRLMPVRTLTFDSVRVLASALKQWEKMLSGAFPGEDWSGRLVRHRYASSRFNFLLWSHPFWLF